MNRKIILLVEDDPDHELLTIRALRRHRIGADIVVARDGVAALEYLFGGDNGVHGVPAPGPPPGPGSSPSPGPLRSPSTGSRTSPSRGPLPSPPPGPSPSPPTNPSPGPASGPSPDPSPGSLPSPLPSIILLDLKLPRLDGFEVLVRVRQDVRTRLVPVVVLSSSDEERDIINSYQYGANSYIRKPVDFAKFTEVTRQLGQYWLELNQVSGFAGGC